MCKLQLTRPLYEQFNLHFMKKASRKSTRKSKPGHAPLAFEDNVILATNVERLRNEQGLDVKRFAQVAGVSRPTLYDIESAKGDPKLSSIRKVAEALDVSIAELFCPPE